MIDRLMQKYGYSKTIENEFGVYYEKQESQNFTHVVCIVRKKSKKHLMQSYDKEVKNGINSVCGVEVPVLILMWLKSKRMIKKYKWNKNGTIDKR